MQWHSSREADPESAPATSSQHDLAPDTTQPANSLSGRPGEPPSPVGGGSSGGGGGGGGGGSGAAPPPPAPAGGSPGRPVDRLRPDDFDGMSLSGSFDVPAKTAAAALRVFENQRWYPLAGWSR